MKIYSYNGFTPYLDEANGEQHVDGFVLEYSDGRKYYFRTALIQIEKVGLDYILKPLKGGVFPSSRADRFVLDLEALGVTETGLIEIMEPSGGFSGEITQHAIKNFISTTQSEAVTRTNYIEGERIRISESDEVFEVVKLAAPTPGNASSIPLQFGTDLYFLSFDAGTYGQLLKQDSSGSTVVVHQFEANANGNGNGTNPIGNLIDDGVHIYIETTSGGLNNKGSLLKYNIATGNITKMLDFSDAIGYIYSLSPFEAVRSLDKIIHNNILFLILPAGGSNSQGTIISINTTNNSVLNIINTTHRPPNSINVVEGYATIYNNIYFAFYAGSVTKINTTNGLEISTTIISFAGFNTYSLASGFRENDVVYLGFGGGVGGFKKFDLATEVFTELGGSGSPDMHVIFKDADFLFGVDVNGQYKTFKYDLINNVIVEDNTTHILQGGTRKLNGSFDPSTGVLYYTAGNTLDAQSQVYKYNVSTKSNSLVYDLQNPTAIQANGTTLLSIPQSSTEGLYLRVRDNHIKSVISSAIGIDVITTRGEVTTIPFPKIEAYSFQYATNTTSSNAINIKGLAGLKNITDNLTIVSRTAAGNPFDGSKLVLSEGIYNIKVSVSISPQVSSNVLRLVIQDNVTNTELAENSVDTNKIFTTRYSASFNSVLIDSATATNGIKIKFNGIETAGSTLNIFDIKIDIIKLGINI